MSYILGSVILKKSQDCMEINLDNVLKMIFVVSASLFIEIQGDMEYVEIICVIICMYMEKF